MDDIPITDPDVADAAKRAQPSRVGRTRLTVCTTFGLLARHSWQRWEAPTPLAWLTGRVRIVEGWVCTRCGRRRAVRRRLVPETSGAKGCAGTTDSSGPQRLA